MIPELREVCDSILSVGVRRCEGNVPRRLLKVVEELGELSEAILNVTCPLNYKNKTTQDIREEAIDCLIVLVDCALTQVHSNTHATNSMMPHNIENGMSAPIPIEWMGREIMRVSAAVARADDAFYAGNEMGFYGALSTAITSISKICFSPMTEDKEEVFSTFLDITHRKLSKWQMMLNQLDKVGKNEAA